MSRNFSGSVERGENTRSRDLAERFAKALGVSLSELIAAAEEEQRGRAQTYF